MERLKERSAFLLIMVLVSSSALATVTRQEVLDEGLRSNHAYSYALAEKAEHAATPEAGKELLEEAFTISPDLPGLYFRRAWTEMPDIFGALDYIARGIKAYGKNFWWETSLAGLVYVSFMVSMVLALGLAAMIRFVADLPLVIHDINEKKAKFLLIAPVLLLAGFGFPVFVLGAVFLTGFYLRGRNKLVFYFPAVLLLLSPLLAELGNAFFSTASPELRAVVAVNENRDNSFPLEALKGRKGFAARFSYATALKRAGRAEEAIKAFSDLLRETSSAKAYNNLGNSYVAAGRYDYAKDSYRKALELDNSAVTLYNLSQVYRDELDFPTGDKYYEDALAVNRDLVTGFTKIAGKGSNRLVVDETLPTGALLRFAWQSRRDMPGFFPVSPMAVAAAAAFLLLLFAVANKGMASRAFRCSRCGRIACEKCTRGGRSRGAMCYECYRVRMSPEDESPKARVARMLQVSEQKNRIRNIVRALSFAPPGVAQIYVGRVLGGFVYLGLFVFAMVVLVLNPLLGTGMAGFTHGWLIPVMILMLVAVYAISFISVNRRLERGWL